MSPKNNEAERTILRKAIEQAPQPIAIIDGEVNTRDKLAELIDSAPRLPDCQDCKGVVVYYRVIEKLFPSSQLSSYEFGLSIPEYAELTRWSNVHGFKVDYLNGTEEMSLRPFYFSFSKT